MVEEEEEEGLRLFIEIWKKEMVDVNAVLSLYIFIEFFQYIFLYVGLYSSLIRYAIFLFYWVSSSHLELN